MRRGYRLLRMAQGAVGKVRLLQGPSIAAGLAVAAAAALLWQALLAHERAQIRRHLLQETVNLSAEINGVIEHRILALTRMARRWEARRRTPRDEWEADVALYVEHQREYQAIEWVDPSFHVRWIVPLEGNEKAQDLNLAFEKRRRIALEAARARREVTVTRTIDLVQGGKGFLVYVPLFFGDTFDGFVLGVLRVPELLDPIFNEHVALGHSMVVFDGEEEIHRRSDAIRQHEEEWGQETELRLRDVTWRLRVWPTPERMAKARSPLPQVALVAGLVMALLLSVTIHLMQTARRRAREIQSANQELAAEIAERQWAERELRALAQALEQRVIERTSELEASRAAALSMMEDADEARQVAEGAEELARQQAKDIERSNAELEQFAYVASHDLQEPLRMVSSFSQLLACRYQDRLDGDAKEFIAYIVDGAMRMRNLINDLLTFSRVGKTADQFAPTDCEVVLDRTLTDLRPPIEESGAVVRHEPLPTVMGDESQIGQLFQNLIANAIKFRSDRPPEVRLGAQAKDGEWQFWVRDNGIGIDPQYADRVFVMFQTLHPREEYGGTGIGLAICKRIVERHGGSIWVESLPGKGATFYFTIPNHGVARA